MSDGGAHGKESAGSCTDDDLDPYRGPTERESLAACGTTPEEIDALNEAFGFPTQPADAGPDDDWRHNYVEGSTSADVLDRVKRGMKIWGPGTSADEIATAESTGEDQD